MIEKNNTMIIKKAVNLFYWVYNRITNKFTSFYGKLKEWFPVLTKYPLLKYGIIPLIIALFFLLRYILKFVINEFAVWTSKLVGETSGYNISEGTIVLGIAAVFIIIRIVLKFSWQKKEK